MEKYFLLNTLELAALEIYFKKNANGYKIERIEPAPIEDHKQVFLSYGTGAAVSPNKAMNMQVGVFIGMAMQRYQKRLKLQFPETNFKTL